jgi:hypothetical protein
VVLFRAEFRRCFRSYLYQHGPPLFDCLVRVSKSVLDWCFPGGLMHF